MTYEPPIQVLQIRSDRLCVYNEYKYPLSNRGRHKNSLENLKKEKYQGNLSHGAKKKMELAITQWAASIGNLSGKELKNETGGTKKIVMVTLTLPSKQLHSDSEIKRLCLNTFLIYAKRKWNADLYIWKAEFQQNDNIHFHILFDRFIPKYELRDVWNNIVEKLGYITEFEKKHGHRSPNSTDIHIIRDQSRTVYYMKKYMSKVESCRLEGGKSWGCSDKLGKLKAMVECMDNGISELVGVAMIEKDCKIIRKDNVLLIYGNIEKIMKVKCPKVYDRYKDFLKISWALDYNVPRGTL